MTQKLDLKAAIWAGVIAGLVFLMLEMALIMLLQGQSPWAPPRMMAAMVMGEGVLPPPATFDFGIMMVAMAVHMMMSIILAVVLGLAISRFQLNLFASLAIGAVFGMLIYFINFYVFTAIFPWFAMARGGIGLFSHAMFGFVLGWVYHAVARHGALGGADHRAAA